MIIGPNAVGKTTTMEAIATELGLPWTNFDNVKPDDPESRQLLLSNLWMSNEEVVLIEGVHFLPLAFLRLNTEMMIGYRPILKVLMTCTPRDMVEHLKERCEKVGKPFNPERWRTRAQQYVRYMERFARQLPGLTYRFQINPGHADCERVKHFVVEMVRHG